MCLKYRANTADQSATADRNEHDVDVGQVLDDLETAGPLSRDDLLIVVRRQEGPAVLLCVSVWLPDTDIVIDIQFILESLGALLPGLFLIQAYYVPMYLKYLGGKNSLWRFFRGTLLVVIVGPLFYPFFLYFLGELWAQFMLLFVIAASGLMFAGALIMHLLVKWWLERNKPTDDLLPPF